MPTGKVAKEFPDTKFAIIDDAAAVGPNIANLTFAEHEGSFLVGAAAALKSKTGNIGFVGGVEVPLIKKFEAGYEAGAKAVKPDIKVQTKYLTQPPDFSGFNDPAKGKTAAEGMYDGGADVVYQAAGGSGGGVFEAAKAAERDGHRGRLRPGHDRRRRCQRRHHHLDAQEGRRGRLRLHQERRPRTPSRPATTSTT